MGNVHKSSSAHKLDRAQTIKLCDTVALAIANNRWAELNKEISKVNNKKLFQDSGSDLLTREESTKSLLDNCCTFWDKEYDLLRIKLKQALTSAEMYTRVYVFTAHLNEFAKQSVNCLQHGHRPPDPETFTSTEERMADFVHSDDSTARLKVLESALLIYQKKNDEVCTRLEKLEEEMKILRDGNLRVDPRALEDKKQEAKIAEKTEEPEKKNMLAPCEEKATKRQDEKAASGADLSRQLTIYFDTKYCTMTTKSVNDLFTMVRERLTSLGLQPKMEMIDQLPTDYSPGNSFVVSFLHYSPSRFQPLLVRHSSDMAKAVGVSNWRGVLLERGANSTEIKQFYLDEITKKATIWTAKWDMDHIDPTHAKITQESLTYLWIEIVRLVQEQIASFESANNSL